MTHLQTLDDQRAMAAHLAQARGIPDVRDCLRAALDCDDGLWDSEKEAALDVLEHVVAFALSMNAEEARKSGSFSARESVAHRLGLGDLVRQSEAGGTTS